MYCNKCGSLIKEDDLFCSKCGNKLETSNQENSYNVKDIVDTYGNDRINAVKYLANTYNLKLTDAKKIVDEEHNRRKIISKSNSWETAKQQFAQKNLEKQQEKNRIEDLKKEKIPYCPKCGSTSLTSNKKGFGIGKAVIGATTPLGALGLTAGNIGAKKIIVTCLNCGYQFKPGKK